MKQILLFCVAWVLLTPHGLVADTVIVPAEPAHFERPTVGHSKLLQIPAKLDIPSDVLILPFFEVDTTSGAGTTTLFAVRNITDASLSVTFAYFAEPGDFLFVEDRVLGAGETRSVNLRDLIADLGNSRGYSLIIADSGAIPSEAVHMEGLSSEPVNRKGGVLPSLSLLTGDFFQVDVGDAFATGERLLSFRDDICLEHEIRFLDFGSGTNLRFLVNNPQGSDTTMDPPSVTIRVYDEAGNLDRAINVFTEDVALEFPSSALTSESFGTMTFDFTNANGGWVHAEYSADGLFSVGLNSACTVPMMATP